MTKIKLILIGAALLAAVLFTQTQTQAAPTKTVNVAWDKSPDPSVTAYKVKDTLTGQTLALVGNTNMASFSLAKNRNYNFVVTALSSNGNESAPSNSVYLPR